MSKVVYLIGAGASAEALPLVKPIYKEIENKAGRQNPYRKMNLEEVLGKGKVLVKGGLSEAFIKIGKELVEGNTLPENQEYVEKLKGQFEDLAIKSRTFDTIDTYGKYCYLKNPD